MPSSESSNANPGAKSPSPPSSVQEASPEGLAPPKAPRLLDQVRSEVRRRHYSFRTEETYVDWVKRFIYFHNKRHPREMGIAEVRSPDIPPVFMSGSPGQAVAFETA